MTTTTIQLNIPYELLVEAISSLDVERKIKLRQLLSDQIASELGHPSPVSHEQRKAALDALGKTVGRILEETGMTEDELVEALAPRKSSHIA